MQHNNMNNAPPTWAKSKQDKEKAPPHKQRQNATRVMERINSPARNATTFIQRPALTGKESSGNQLLLSFNAPPIQAKNKQSEVRVPPITHAVLFPVKTLAISPKKKWKGRATCFGMPRHAPAKANRLSTQKLILFSYFSERPALTGQD